MSSSQPTSPAAAPNSSQLSASSPQSKADSAVHIDDTPERPDPDSSFQSNSSERHPKGKRKRTAAKDKAILEAAYNANPKPDKAARLDIVQRVSLNEKEVQIWFQNRRQNDRRKSRPLSPQEIAALQYGGMQVLSSDSAPYSTNPPPTSGMAASDTYQLPPPPMSEGENASTSTGRTERLEPADASVAEAGSVRMMRRQSVASVAIPTALSSQAVEFTAGRPHQPEQPYRSSSVGYFANRLHAATSSQYPRRSPDSYSHEFMPASRPSSAAAGPLLPPPQSSKFRLSMSVEGKAELVQQASPSRLSPSTVSDSSVPLERPNVQRSHSVVGPVTLPPISALTASLEANAASSSQPRILQQPQPRLHPRLYRSRSRDVHAWEMACESSIGEHRDELTAYAERESSGSAIAAISLLRTLSSSSQMPTANHSTGVLQSNNAKRNARPNAHPSAHLAKKPKIGRSSSSIGRLQTQFVNTTSGNLPLRRDETDLDADENKKVNSSILCSPGGNDSDKENWSPDSDGNAVFRGAHRMPAGRRPLPSAPLSKTLPSTDSLNSRRTMGRVLGDSTNRSFLGRASTAPTGRRKRGESPVEIFTDGGDDADTSDNEDQHRVGRSGVTDDEVEKFMRGEISPSKKGAAGAIAGLLALSQGNWR